MRALLFISTIVGCGAVLLATTPPAQDVTERRLNSRIPAAVHAKYKHIRDAN